MHHLTSLIRTDYLSPSFVIDLYIEFFLGEVALLQFARSQLVRPVAPSVWLVCENSMQRMSQ